MLLDALIVLVKRNKTLFARVCVVERNRTVLLDALMERNGAVFCGALHETGQCFVVHIMKQGSVLWCTL